MEKSKIAPEKCWLEDYFHFELVPFFTGHVHFQGGILFFDYIDFVMLFYH